MKKSSRFLLDASAIIALLKKEKGYQRVDEVLANSAMASINFSEVVSALVREGVSEEDVEAITENLVPEIIPFDRNSAMSAGKLIKSTKEYGLSLGDRACIATAEDLEMDVYTTDKAWANLQDKLNIKIHVIR